MASNGATSESGHDVEGIAPYPGPQVEGAEPCIADIKHADAAKSAAEHEQQMGLIASAHLYPKAIMFSCIMSLAIVMEGYDTSLLGGFFAPPAFQLKFGKPAGNGIYQVSAPWQAGFQNGAAVGEILGLWGAGLLAERFGYIKTLMGCLIILTGALFVSFFAVDMGMLFAGEILCGLPWGAFQTLTTPYAADVTPIHLRPVLTSFVNLCWVAGSLIASGVQDGFASNLTQWGGRSRTRSNGSGPYPSSLGLPLLPNPRGGSCDMDASRKPEQPCSP